MKCTLVVNIVGYPADHADRPGSETYWEFTKEIELPMMPVPQSSIFVPPLPGSGDIEEELMDDQFFDINEFHVVDRVFINAESQEVVITTYMKLANHTLEEAEQAARRLEQDYGFENRNQDDWEYNDDEGRFCPPPK